MTETWRPIPGYEGLYDVSDLGRVRSWKVHRGRPGPRLLMPWAVDGYFRVTLWGPNGGHLTRKVHQLMAAAFIGPRPEGFETRHLDGNGLNNTLPNLAYGTRSENQQDTLRHGMHANANRTHCPLGHPYDEENTYVNSAGGRECRTCRQARGAARYPKRLGPPMCQNGLHERTSDNIYVSKAERLCRPCLTAKAARYRARRKAQLQGATS